MERCPDGTQYREASRSRALALNAACDLISQRHTVQRIEGRHGVIIGPEQIERLAALVRDRRERLPAAATAPLALLPTPSEALDLPLAAFPSWFLKITCDRCGKDRMLNEVHAPQRQREMPIGCCSRERAMTAAAAGQGRWAAEVDAVAGKRELH